MLYDDWLITILLFISDRLSSPKRDSLLVSTAKKTLELMFIGLIGSGFFYWRLVGGNGLRDGFNTWTIALDISFAHAFVTLPLSILTLIVIIIACIVLWLSLRPLLSLVATIKDWILVLTAFFVHQRINEDHKKEIRTRISQKSENDSRPNSNLYARTIWKLFDFILSVFLILLPGYGIYWVIQMLLVDYTDLQVLLFGAYDRSLGWEYPTTYRFTFIYNNLSSYVELITHNEVIAVILGSIGMFVTIILGIGALLRALGEIGKWRRAR